MPRKAGRPPTPLHRVKHGAKQGYEHHVNHKTPLCEPCRVWRRQHQAEYRANKRRQLKILRQILLRGRGNGTIPFYVLEPVLKYLRYEATDEELEALKLERTNTPK